MHLKVASIRVLIMMEIETANQSEIVDITAGVEQYVQESGIENGICLVSSLHTLPPFDLGT